MKPHTTLKPQARNEVAKAADLMRLGRDDEALAICRETARTFPNDASAHHLLGVLLGKTGATDEAVAALEKAVRLAPKDAAAWMNLGIVALASNPARAEQSFRRTLQIAPDAIAARGNLATLLYKGARYREAEEQLAPILKAMPNSKDALQLLGRIQRMKANFQGEIAILQKLLQMNPNDEDARANMSRAYFLWYDSVDSDPAKAVPILEQWLAFEPDAPVARHMHASLTSKNVPERATAGYVEHHFDAFAATFDSVLSSLKYRGPEIIRELLARELPKANAALDVVDIGCGTGRFGPLVAPWKKLLVGVDLSAKMLDVARPLGVYDALEHADVLTYLGAHGGSFDVAACLDTMVYFGDLAELLAKSHDALRARGLLFATVETLDEAQASDFVLHKGGRYAHKTSYVRRALEAAGFALGESIVDTVRFEHEVAVPGLFFVARRTG